MKHLNSFPWAVSAALVLTLSACSSDDAVDNTAVQPDKAFPITLTTPLTAASRAAAAQTTTIAKDELVYAWADRNDTKKQWFGAWTLKADGKNGLSPTTQNNLKYFPGGGKTINLYLIHGNFNYTEGADFPSDAILYKVHEDQRTKPGNYLTSDLLYGTIQGVSHQTTAVSVPTYHMLSNVRVILKSGSDALSDADLQNAVVDLVNIQPATNFTPAKTDATSMQTPATRAAMLKTNTTEKLTTIHINTAISPKANSEWGTDYGEAVLPPQTLSGNHISVILHPATSGSTKSPYDGLQLYAEINKELVSGYSYEIHVTVTPTELSVSDITVTNWGTADNRSVDLDGSIVK